MAGFSVPSNSCGPCGTPRNTGCLAILSDKCVYWSANNVPTIGINTGDNYSVVLGKLITFITTGSTSTTSTSTTSTTSTTTTSTTTAAPISTIQFMWVVGGANNFGTIPGAPSPPGNGAVALVTGLISNLNVRVWRGGLRQMGINPGNGDTYYTKTTSSNTLVFSAALTTGEEIIVETIPQ